jgi:Ca-activated chloride channel family protein
MRARQRSTLRRPLAAVFLATTIASAAPSADDVRVVGSVVHASHGTPLGATQVHIRELNVGGLTDTSGRFSLTVPAGAIPSGEVHLVAQRIGFRTAEIALSGEAFLDSEIRRDFRLEEEPLQLDELIVPGAPGATQRRAIGDVVSAGAAPTVIASRPGPTMPLATGDTPWNREQYAHIEENDFKLARDNPLSTLSIDVDRASYSNVRRFLIQERRLPPVDAVQIEEMVNYFTYDYPRPTSGHPIAVTTELGRAPWRPEHRLLRVGLASTPIDTEELPPSNLVFLLDVSGSMQSWDKLPLVKRSMRLLVDQLRPDDRVAIVVYAGAAGLVLESTPGTRKDRILAAIDRLEAGGSTAGGAGLRLAYQVARDAT